MLSNPEKIQILQLLQDPRWQTVERYIKMLIEELNTDSTLRDNEWETLKTTLLKEGKIQGITELTQKLYEAAQDIQT